MQKRNVDIWEEDCKTHPSYILPVEVSLFGTFCIFAGLLALYLADGPLGMFFAIILVPGGLLFISLGIGTFIKAWSKEESLGTNLYDQAFLKNYKRYVKETFGYIALIAVLFLCLGCLMFL